MEILNFDYNYKKLAIKALNKSKTITEASILIGIDERLLYRWMKKYKIKKCIYGEVIQGS
jgi:transcriptional regulator of acetoin/glycerol metabolism